MNHVIDSSVALKWVVPEADSDKALRLLADYAAAIHQLLAPDLFPIEITNALASAEKSARIQPGEAVLFLTDILNNAPVLHESTPLLRRALQISLPTRHSIYDCLYIALAERESCQFVTSDTKLIKGLQPQYPFIVPLASLP
jgi:predicted nucleic acid-binding protein